MPAPARLIFHLLAHTNITGARRTSAWQVQSQIALGTVKWFAPWRRYCFFPNADMVFDHSCLGEITAFLDKQMALRQGEPTAK